MIENPYLECRANCCRTGRRDTCYQKLKCACHDGWRGREKVRDETAEYYEYLRRHGESL